MKRLIALVLFLMSFNLAFADNKGTKTSDNAKIKDSKRGSFYGEATIIRSNNDRFEVEVLSDDVETEIVVYDNEGNVEEIF